MVGYEVPAYESPVAMMWVNGAEKRLPVGDMRQQSVATAVTWGPEKPIVAGYYPYNTGLNKLDHEAKLWHNGEIAQSLQGNFTGNTIANGIVANSTDVYVVGFHMVSGLSKAIYWKNAEPVYLTAVDNRSAFEAAYAIAVRGNDVIVGGSDGVVSTFATLWTNGVKQRLSNGLSVVSAVTATESGVYAAGYARGQNQSGVAATVWANGAEQQLTNAPPSKAFARSIRVASNRDVYVAGVEYVDFNDNNDQARLWKNGVPQPLEGAVAGSGAHAVEIVGNDVYVAGQIDNGGDRTIAALWVNGKLTRMSDGSKTVIVTGLAVR